MDVWLFKCNGPLNPEVGVLAHIAVVDKDLAYLVQAWVSYIECCHFGSISDNALLCHIASQPWFTSDVICACLEGQDSEFLLQLYHS